MIYYSEIRQEFLLVSMYCFQIPEGVYRSVEKGDHLKIEYFHYPEIQLKYRIIEGEFYPIGML